jgi:hypothetical protein
MIVVTNVLVSASVVAVPLRTIFWVVPPTTRRTAMAVAVVASAAMTGLSPGALLVICL